MRLKIFVLLVLAFLMLSALPPLYATGKGSISGQVTDKETGLGIPNVKVTLTMVDKVTATDDRGYYSFTNLNPGKYAVELFPPHPYCCDPAFNSCRRIFVVTGGENFVFNKAVEIGGSIRGFVYKAKGIPFPDVTVEAFSLDGSSNSSKTKKDGSYFVGGLYPAKDYYVHFSHKIPGHSYRFIIGIKVAKDECTLVKDYIFDFKDETGIDGYVKSALDGCPLSDVKISVCYVHGEYETGKNLECGSILTDSNGYFCIKNLEYAGKLRLFTSIPGPPPKDPNTGKPLYTFGEYVALNKKINLKVEKGRMHTISIKIDIPSYNLVKKKE